MEVQPGIRHVTGAIVHRHTVAVLLVDTGRVYAAEIAGVGQHVPVYELVLAQADKVDGILDFLLRGLPAREEVRGIGRGGAVGQVLVGLQVLYGHVLELARHVELLDGHLGHPTLALLLHLAVRGDAVLRLQAVQEAEQGVEHRAGRAGGFARGDVELHGDGAVRALDALVRVGDAQGLVEVTLLARSIVEVQERSGHAEGLHAHGCALVLTEGRGHQSLIIRRRKMGQGRVGGLAHPDEEVGGVAGNLQRSLALGGDQHGVARFQAHRRPHNLAGVGVQLVAHVRLVVLQPVLYGLQVVYVMEGTCGGILVRTCGRGIRPAEGIVAQEEAVAHRGEHPSPGIHGIDPQTGVAHGQFLPNRSERGRRHRGCERPGEQIGGAALAEVRQRIARLVVAVGPGGVLRQREAVLRRAVPGGEIERRRVGELAGKLVPTRIAALGSRTDGLLVLAGSLSVQLLEILRPGENARDAKGKEKK